MVKFYHTVIGVGLPTFIALLALTAVGDVFLLMGIVAACICFANVYGFFEPA